MNYSKIHQKFSVTLKEPDSLANPEKYLGKNYKAVLGFWSKLDTFTDEKWEEFSRLHCSEPKVAAREATYELIADVKNPTYFLLFTKFFNPQ